MRFRSEKGAAAVEFAVILPVLLVVVFGIIEFGLIFYNKAMITNASREAARSAILYATDADGNLDRPTSAEIEAIVNNYCKNYLITFSTTAQTPQITTNPASPETITFGDLITVTVAYRYDYLLLPGFITDLAGGVDLVANTTMRAE